MKSYSSIQHVVDPDRGQVIPSASTVVARTAPLRLIALLWCGKVAGAPIDLSFSRPVSRSTWRAANCGRPGSMSAIIRDKSMMWRPQLRSRYSGAFALAGRFVLIASGLRMLRA